jgi:hypothetical protein
MQDERFIEFLKWSVVVFICKEDCKNLADLSSTLAKALVISAAVSYAAINARLRSAPSQRSAAFVLDNPAIIRQLFVMKRLEPPHRFSPP